MHRVSLRASFALLMLTGLLSSCGSSHSPLQPVDPFEERKIAADVAPDVHALVDANNQFTLDLYGRLRATPGNLFLSAYSISTAFAMANAGAAGTTRDEIVNVFRFPLPQERLDPAFGALQHSLDRGNALGGYQLEVANRAWGQRDFPFLAPYVSVTRDHYGAEIQPADFAKDAEAERHIVNAWVQQRTHDRIVDLFPDGSIASNTRLVLANAIYFKGLWAAQFDKSKTRDWPFQLTNGERVSVKTMVQKSHFLVAGNTDAQMIDLPYKGGDLSMWIVLPRHADGLADLEAGLTVDKLEALRSGLHEQQELDLLLPSFKFSSKFNLPQVLSGMGMPSAFDGYTADFSGIDGRRDLSITGAFHQAFVEVNEEGTEAAAATGISMGETSAAPSFVADHPFLFLIYDHVTGSILFVGRVIDPRG